MTLLKENHPNRDFFIADIFDNLPVKDDMASMEHPIFVLSKKKDMRNLEYRKDNISISIKPTTDGLPTIFDKDILLYCGSQLIQEVNAGRIPPKTLRISSHDLLIATNRQTNDDGYRRLKQALSRLSGVRIQTNIKTNKRVMTNDFGLLESWRIIESSRVKDRMVRLEITLSEWFYNSILGKEVLTINRDYFRLGKPMERRLYELARKHCGKQEQWEVGLVSLMEKTGSTGTLRKFRLRIKEISQDSHIPDYSFTLDENDLVTITNRNFGTQNNQLSMDIIQPLLKLETREKARQIVFDAGTNWDYDALEEQFTTSVSQRKFTPDNNDAAFIGFVRKKVEKWA